MKKILSTVLTFAFIFIESASAQTDPVKQQLDNIFLNINKSLVPSGYLDEYGPQFAEKKWYNGVLADSNIIQGLTAFRMLYNDIENSKIFPAAPTVTPLNTFNATLGQLPNSATVPLAIFIGKYASLNENAIIQN